MFGMLGMFCMFGMYPVIKPGLYEIEIHFIIFKVNKVGFPG